jgi:hypothetical protein
MAALDDTSGFEMLTVRIEALAQQAGALRELLQSAAQQATEREIATQVAIRQLQMTLESGDRPNGHDRENGLATITPNGAITYGQYQELVQRIRDIVVGAVPLGATVLVVSRGDPQLVQFLGRVGWHFPQTERGEYAGHHPANSTDAIAHLEELRDRGARFLLFPCTASWWLDYYDELRTYLETRYRQRWSDDDCVIFELESAEPERPSKGRHRR